MNDINRKPTALRRFFAMFAMLALVIVTGGFAPVYAEAPQGVGNPNQECEANGFDFGITKYEWENDWVEEIDGDFPRVGYTISATGSAQSVAWTATPAVAGIVAFAANVTDVFPGGTNGTIDAWVPVGESGNFHDISHVTLCGNNPEQGPTTGTIVVKKEFGSTTTPVSFNLFSFSVNGSSSITFDVSGENTLTEQATGTYNIIEDSTHEYVASYSNCTFDLLAGETQTCVITNTSTTSVPELLCEDETANNYGESLPCTYDTPVVNSCLVPSTLGDISEFTIGTSSEVTLQTILNQTYGAGVLDVIDDQMNYQVWNIVTPNTATVTLNVKLLGKEAHNTQTFGYYHAGDGTTFVPLLTVPPTLVGTTFPVSIDVSSINAIGFAIKTVGIDPNTTWHSEWALNPDNMDNLAVYNPSADTYALAFEDLRDFDFDYNDLVAEITDVLCIPTSGTEGNGGNGDNGQNGDDTGTGGDSTTFPTGGGGGLLNPTTVRDSRTVDEARERPTPTTTLTPAAPRPTGMVGGEQVSVIPYGAPNTGAGGTSGTPSHAVPLLALAAFFASLLVLRRTAYEA
jgi:hypothetical protein